MEEASETSNTNYCLKTTIKTASCFEGILGRLLRDGNGHVRAILSLTMISGVETETELNCRPTV